MAQATLHEMKTEKTLRMLKLLSMLQAQAARARKLQGGARRAAKPPKAPDPAQVAELKQAFEFFDKDESGFIDKTELGLVLQSLGSRPSDSDLAVLYCEMDPSGDGQIDVNEFISVMAQDPAEKPSARSGFSAPRPVVQVPRRARSDSPLHCGRSRGGGHLHLLRPRR